MKTVIIKLSDIKQNYIDELSKYGKIQSIQKYTKTVILSTNHPIALFKSLPFVVSVSYDTEYKISDYIAPEQPTDFIPAAARYLTNYEAFELHSTLKEKGNNIKVAVLDTGVNLTNPYLKKNIKYIKIAPGKDNDPYGHGTWITSFFVSKKIKTPYGIIQGAIPKATIYSIKVLDDTGTGRTSWLLEGINKALENKCQIANLSLSSPLPDPVLGEVINETYNKMLYCVAAGNFGITAKAGFPASHQKTIAVGSDYFIKKFYLSSFSPQNVDLVSTGGEITTQYILSPTKNSIYGMVGTSMATPIVSAIATQLIQRYKFNPEQLLTKLKTYGSIYPRYNKHYGYGVIIAKEEEDILEEVLSIIHSDSKQ